MKRIIMLLVALYISQNSFAQFIVTINVGGDISKYYPVVFNDAGWDSNIASEVQIGRSNIHLYGGTHPWLGSIIATFRYHSTSWGNGSEFINADIHQKYTKEGGNYPLIGGWMDPTVFNANHEIIIWLRGNTTYFSRSNYDVHPVAYVGTDYIDGAGGVHTLKTAPDNYVNRQGISYDQTAYFNGSGVNFFGGSVGIGTIQTKDYKLAVAGTIGAKRVKVTQTDWADFVFDKAYQLPSLQAVENYILQYNHLPEVPTTEEVKNDGVDIGEMNKILLQKVEELTLYLIEQQKEMGRLKTEMSTLKQQIGCE